MAANPARNMANRSAGVRDKTPFHQFLVDIPAKDAQGKLLPEISAAVPLPPGSADKAVQSYNFRMCFSEAADRIPFAKPADYDPHRYELLARLIEARTKAEGHPPALGTLMKIDRLPNGTTDVNNNGAFSTDYIGGSWEYPNATYAQTRRNLAGSQELPGWSVLLPRERTGASRQPSARR